METAFSYEEPELTPAEWQRRQAKAIEVIAAHVSDRAQRMEMLEMLGLAPSPVNQVA